MKRFLYLFLPFYLFTFLHFFPSYLFTFFTFLPFYFSLSDVHHRDSCATELHVLVVEFLNVGNG